MIPKCFGQVFHGLLTFALATTFATALGDAHVLKHLVQLRHALLRLGHAPFFHQLLDFIHHLLKLIWRDFLTIARLLLIARLAVALLFLRKLAQIIL